MNYIPGEKPVHHLNEFPLQYFIYRTSATPMNESEMWQRQKSATGQEEMMNALVQGIWAYVSQHLLNLHHDFPVG